MKWRMENERRTSCGEEESTFSENYLPPEGLEFPHFPVRVVGGRINGPVPWTPLLIAVMLGIP